MKSEKQNVFNRTAEQVAALIERAAGEALDEQGVYDAQAAYYHLSAEEKAKVPNLPRLTGALDSLLRQYIGPKEGPRLDRAKLCIGTYGFAKYCWTEEHVKALADCGIHYFCGGKADEELLNLLSKHGIVTVLSYLPGWWGGELERNGKMADLNPLSGYEEKIAAYEDHPAVFAVAVSDEASSWDFPYHAVIVDKLKEGMPGILPYINLQNAGPGLPDMGAPTYEEYIEEYMQKIPLDYISYDHYMYSWGIDRAFQAYEAVASRCRKYGKDMWVILQVNHEKHMPGMTIKMLRFQAYSALAYGAKNLNWACWTDGWWADNVVTPEGELTERYDLLKEINAELTALSPTYMWFDCEETFFIDNCSSAWPVRFFLERDGAVPSGTQEVFTHFKTSERTAVLAGYFKKKNGRGHAMMLLDLEDPWGLSGYPSPDSLKKKPVTFRVNALNSRVTAHARGEQTPLIPDSYGNFTVVLEDNNGVFITVEEN